MNMKIPLLSLAASLTVGCFEDVEKEEVEEEEEEADDINGDWSLSSSEESCLEMEETYDGYVYSYSYCFSFSKFDLSIADGAVASSDVVVEIVETETDDEGTEVYEDTYETSVSSISGEGTSYSLEIADGEVTLACTLSGSSLECEGEVDAEEGIMLQATLTK